MLVLTNAVRRVPLLILLKHGGAKAQTEATHPMRKGAKSGSDPDGLARGHTTLTVVVGPQYGELVNEGANA